MLGIGCYPTYLTIYLKIIDKRLGNPKSFLYIYRVMIWNLNPPLIMNDFDFYIVKAYSPSIRSLMKVGTFERTAIKSNTDWSGRFPKTTYDVNLGYVDVMGIGHLEARKRADEMVGILPNIDRVKYHIEFILRD